MNIPFNYIKNRIREYDKQELLDACYSILDQSSDKITPIWFVFSLMKWTYQYAGEKRPTKQLTPERFKKLLRAVTNFNQEYITDFFKDEGVDKAFQILYSQQFYLQTPVYKEVFATQLKLYSSITCKYDLEKEFEHSNGISIKDFLYLLQIIWLYSNIDVLENKPWKFDNYLNIEVLKLLSEMTSTVKLEKFLNLLVLDPFASVEKINEFKKGLRNVDFQTLEQTFFILHPFQIHRNTVRLVHKRILNYSINYFLYDYMKIHDEKFTTEFGSRLEKFVEFGLKEMNLSYKTENDIRKEIGKDSNVIDYYIESQNIFIEVKAVELQSYPSINPTDELIYNSLKDSILKAYYKQLLPVSSYYKAGEENWGIIITYKKLYWSDFVNLYELSKDKFENSDKSNCLPPTNLFIIDIHTWNRITQVVNENKIKLRDLLKIAKANNSDFKTRKQSFDMHLDQFVKTVVNIKYLEPELKMLEIKQAK